MEKTTHEIGHRGSHFFPIVANSRGDSTRLLAVLFSPPIANWKGDWSLGKLFFCRLEAFYLDIGTIDYFVFVYYV